MHIHIYIHIHTNLYSAKNRENESEAHNGRQNVETKSDVKMERCYQWHQWTLFNCYHESVHLAQWNSKHFTQKQQALYCYAKGLANLQSGLCLLRVARVTAGLMKSNGSLPPGLWLMSPAGWLPRTGISSGIPCSAIEYGLPLPFFVHTECEESSSLAWMTQIAARPTAPMTNVTVPRTYHWLHPHGHSSLDSMHTHTN